ncbi:MAG: hypothetical protein ACI4EG_15220 [Fusicatenibacter sp.]
MEEAARLLTESNFRNKEIMQRVGHTDRKQFYKKIQLINCKQGLYQHYPGVVV